MPTKSDRQEVMVGQEYEDTDKRTDGPNGPRRVRVIQMYVEPGKEWMASCVTIGSNRKVEIACRRLQSSDYRLVKQPSA